MAKLPIVSAKDLIRALEKEGFQVVRQKGSHVVLQKRTPSETVTTVAPYHDEIAKGTLKSILRKAKISPEHLIKLLTLLLGVSPYVQP